MIYLIAGSLEEAKAYRYQAGFRSSQAVTVVDYKVIARSGLKPGDRIVRTGTWFDRNDLGAIEPSIAHALGPDLQVTNKGLVKRR